MSHVLGINMGDSVDKINLEVCTTALQRQQKRINPEILRLLISWRTARFLPDRPNRVCEKSLFTIFILGLGRRSLPVLVTESTTINNIYQHLSDLGLIPSAGRRYLHFNTLRGQKASWGDTGRRSDSALYTAGSSSSRSKRKRNEERMQEVLEAEDLDSDGNPVADQPPKKRKTKTKLKKAAPKRVGTDPEDEDFDGEESAESDSESEVEITNVELAEALPTETLPTRGQKFPVKNKGKGKATTTTVPNPPKSEPIPVDDNTASSSIAGPSKPAKKGLSHSLFGRI
ncbi:hypothetical protein B0H14DRAFT_2557204 [Mycena olivaceomarginata]|nr:hypothetical protein B0H14DRAFT_2557204 [Mycena olivaceomarginata]